MKITAAIVPARSQPFEIAELDLAAHLRASVVVQGVDAWHKVGQGDEGFDYKT